MAEKDRKNLRAVFGELPRGKIAFCVLTVYVAVASNYLSLDKREVSFLLKHPAAQVVLVFLLALTAVREPGHSWWLSVTAAAVVSGLFYLLAHVL